MDGLPHQEIDVAFVKTDCGFELILNLSGHELRSFVFDSYGHLLNPDMDDHEGFSLLDDAITLLGSGCPEGIIVSNRVLEWHEGQHLPHPMCFAEGSKAVFRALCCSQMQEGTGRRKEAA